LKHLKIKGIIEEQCRVLASKGKENPDELMANAIRFLQGYRDRVDKKELRASTIRNYVKAIKLSCEMNDILLPCDFMPPTNSMIYKSPNSVVFIPSTTI
jgi:hypothetical protein